MCVSGCPYKKVYFNWNSGKAEKCILCYPRLEMGEAPACMHSCVGKIRYLGVVLYDADRIEESASRPESELVEAQRDMILDPFDPEVIREAANRNRRKIMESAQKSPVFKFVKQWRMALPLHPEWRTLPMLFYVPPLLPVTATLNQQGFYEMETDFFSSLENARLPIRYMASLFSAGDESEVIAVYRKLLGVRIYKRAQTVGDISMETAQRAIEEGALDPGGSGKYFLPDGARGVRGALGCAPVYAGTGGRTRNRHAGVSGTTRRGFPVLAEKRLIGHGSLFFVR